MNRKGDQKATGCYIFNFPKPTGWLAGCDRALLFATPLLGFFSHGRSHEA